MRVAVVGGGIFGCTAAIEIARAGHDTHLFEANDSLLRCASGINQFRLHAGYHYPRSPETIAECKRSIRSFRTEYSKSTIVNGEHYYAVASPPRSRLRADEYLAILKKNRLNYEIASPGFVDGDSVDVVIKAKDEYWIDPVILRGLVYDMIANVGVTLHMGSPADGGIRKEFDRIVIATYSATNEMSMMLETGMQEFQYEVCEKLVLQLPGYMCNSGIVVMDGGFCSLDPFGNTGFHLLGHVDHAIHSRNDGIAPAVPPELIRYIDAGVIYEPEPSRSEMMIEATAEFIPLVGDAEYIGSMFTIRAVLPQREATDERPTLVSELDAQVIRIFSGKIGTACEAAKQAVQLIGTQSAREAA